MNITVDTNVLISATFWSGDSNKIIELVENGKLTLVLSKEIVQEFSEVLNYEEIQNKIKNKNLEMKYSLHKIISLSKIVDAKEKLDFVKEDPDDNKLLECAIEGNADYIITNDKHLLKLKEYKGISIIKPEDFLKLIRV